MYVHPQINDTERLVEHEEYAGAGGVRKELWDARSAKSTEGFFELLTSPNPMVLEEEEEGFQCRSVAPGNRNILTRLTRPERCLISLIQQRDSFRTHGKV